MKLRSDNDSAGTDTIQSGYQPGRVHDQSCGLVQMTPHENMAAGSFVTLSFRYMVGEQGFAEGGVLRIGTPCTGWGEPLPPRSRYWFAMQPPAYFRRNTMAELTTAGDAQIKLSVEKRMLRYTPPGGAWRWWITIQVEKASLAPGDVITVVYGDTRWGERGAQVQKFPEKEAYFEVLVDVEGTGEYVEIPGSPLTFDIVSGQASRLKVTLPSLVGRANPFDIRLALTDDFHNLAQPTSVGSITLQDVTHDPPHRVEIKPDAAEMSLSDKASFVFENRGVHRLRAHSARPRIQTQSNPVLVQEETPQEQIYWGDLHTQSKFHGPGSWSVGTPDELYRYAREVSHLDFAAITDDAAPIGEGWFPIQQAAIDHYEPGAFVTFKAFEWCSKKYGHRNTIFGDLEVEEHYPRDLFEGTIEEFWDYFRGKNVIMIPHHTLVWTDWDYHDPELEPLVELYSIWGASEKVGNPLWSHSQIPGGGVQAALARGYRLGIIGSTDTHAGTPGRSVPNADRFQWQPYKGGLAAVYAAELTREGIFEALRARRTYGTTGTRIILDFRLNGRPMGSELIIEADEHPTLTVKAVGSDRIRKVEIIRNNLEAHQFDVDEYQVELEWTDPILPSQTTLRGPGGESINFYYVRLIQVDGEMAWTSPIWLQLTHRL